MPGFLTQLSFVQHGDKQVICHKKKSLVRPVDNSWFCGRPRHNNRRHDLDSEWRASQAAFDRTLCFEIYFVLENCTVRSSQTKTKTRFIFMCISFQRQKPREQVLTRIAVNVQVSEWECQYETDKKKRRSIEKRRCERFRCRFHQRC